MHRTQTTAALNSYVSKHRAKEYALFFKGYFLAFTEGSLEGSMHEQEVGSENSMMARL